MLQAIVQCITFIVAFDYHTELTDTRPVLNCDRVHKVLTCAEFIIKAVIEVVDAHWCDRRVHSSHQHSTQWRNTVWKHWLTTLNTCTLHFHTLTLYRGVPVLVYSFTEAYKEIASSFVTHYYHNRILKLKLIQFPMYPPRVSTLIHCPGPQFLLQYPLKQLGVVATDCLLPKHIILDAEIELP